MPVEPSLTLTRHLKASPQEAFDAWTQPARLREWWGPGEQDRTSRVELNLKAGGGYHFVTHAESGATYDFRGQYREVSLGEKLVFSWEPTPGREPESWVTVTFTTNRDGARLTLVHEGLASEAERDECLEGWEGALDKLVQACEDWSWQAASEASSLL